MISARFAAWGDHTALALLSVGLFIDFSRAGDRGSAAGDSALSGASFALAALLALVLRHLIVPRPSLRERLTARRQARASFSWPGQRLWLPTRRDWLWAAGLLTAATVWALRDQLPALRAADGVLWISSLPVAGLTMFVLVRTLTRQVLPALLAGVCFAFDPYRLSDYPGSDATGAFLMPLALLLLWRVLQAGRRGDALALGVLIAAQLLWSMDLGAVLIAGLLTVAIVRWAAGHFRWRDRARVLVTATLVAAVIVVPASLPSWGAQAVAGTRAPAEVEPSGARHRPGIASIVLAAVALVPPLSPLAATAGVGLLVAVDGSLYRLSPPFGAHRSSGSFSALISLFLALLAGLGLHRCLGPNPRRARMLLACGLVAFAFIELTATPMPTSRSRAPASVHLQ